MSQRAETATQQAVRNAPRTAGWRSRLLAAAPLLAREQLMLVAPLVALPLLAERRWRLLSGFVALALGPFAAWQLMLR